MFGLLAWIILGLVSGFIASKIMNKSGAGIFMDIILGIVGSVVGGWLMRIIGSYGVTGLDLRSIIVSVLGAVVVLWVFNKINRR